MSDSPTLGLLLKLKAVRDFVQTYKSKQARLESLDLLGVDTGGIPWTKKTITRLETQLAFIKNSLDTEVAKLARQTQEKIDLTKWIAENEQRYEECEFFANDKMTAVAKSVERQIQRESNVG